MRNKFVHAGTRKIKRKKAKIRNTCSTIHSNTKNETLPHWHTFQIDKKQHVILFIPVRKQRNLTKSRQQTLQWWLHLLILSTAYKHNQRTTLFLTTHKLKHNYQCHTIHLPLQQSYRQTRQRSFNRINHPSNKQIFSSKINTTELPPKHLQ